MGENSFASESLHNQKQMDLQVQTGLRRTEGHLHGSFRSLRIFVSTWTRLHRGRNLFTGRGTRFTQSLYLNHGFARLRTSSSRRQDSLFMRASGRRVFMCSSPKVLYFQVRNIWSADDTNHCTAWNSHHGNGTRNSTRSSFSLGCLTQPLTNASTSVEARILTTSEYLSFGSTTA
jgi:hypothetical protein